MTERVLGFNSEGMQKGKKYITFRTNKLVSVVELKWLEEYCKKKEIKTIDKGEIILSESVVSIIDLLKAAKKEGERND